MRLNKEKTTELVEYRINDDMVALCCPKEGFQKLMVLYRYGKPVWAHRDCLLAKKDK